MIIKSAVIKPQYNCRFHPTDFWHEVGCSHMSWTKEELQDALDTAKMSHDMLLDQLVEATKMMNTINHVTLNRIKQPTRKGTTSRMVSHGTSLHPLGEKCEFCDRVKRESKVTSIR